MSPTEQELAAEQLYGLLPAVYRSRDAAAGGQLQALFGVLATQSAIVAANLRQLYDDHFIETCAPWVIPYLGDLIGYNSQYEIASVNDTRAEVANTILARQRKGTKIALQQVAIDVSGRAAVVVEEFQRLVTTQSMRHLRPENLATVSIRDAGRLLREASSNGIADSPFDLANRVIDVRRIGPRAPAAACAPAPPSGSTQSGSAQSGSARPGRAQSSVPPPDPTPLDIALHGGGRANIHDVAIHLWRWQAFTVTKATAFPVDGPGGRRYRFSPLGADLALFTPQQLPATPFTAFLTRGNVPQPITRAELAQFYGPSGAVLLTADGTDVPAKTVIAANLADRALPAAGGGPSAGSGSSGGSTGPGGLAGSWCTVPPGMIAIDPELGRIQFSADLTVPQSLQVTYCYGLPWAIGGGPYSRADSLKDAVPDDPGFPATVGSADYPTLASAVAGWNSYAAGTGGSAAPEHPTGVIKLPVFTSLTEDITGSTAIQLSTGSHLAIVAAPYDNALATITGDIEVARQPATSGSGTAGSGTTATGTAPTPAAAAGGHLLLSGIWLAGQLTVSGDQCTVTLTDCTLVPGHGLLPDGTPLHPGEPSVLVTAKEGASLQLTRVISGPIAAAEGGSTSVIGSILDATSPYYVAHAGPDLASAGPDLTITGSTVIGKVRARTITLASNSIFHARLGDADPWTAPVWASRRQAGCVRFCWLPPGSITPRRYSCLPPEQAAADVWAPQFITTRYGRGAYCLLAGDCPVAIWTGADNGSQLGVYWQAQETEAVRNVQIRGPEYLPARLEAGIFLHPAHVRGHPRPAGGYGYGYGSGSSDGGFTGIGADLI